MQKILFYLLLIKFILTQQNCGIQSLFQDEYQLTQNGVLFSQQNLSTNDNGQKITIFGWFQISQDGPQLKPLIQLQLLSDQNIQQNNQVIVQLAYDTTNTIQNQLIVEIANSDNTTMIQNIQTQIPYDTPIFTVVSLDYSQSLAKIYMQTYSNQVDFSLEEIIDVIYVNFRLTQNFVINIGFFNDPNLTQQEILNNSMIGSVRDFSYILEYFEDLNYLLYIRPQSSTNINFLFDFQGQQNNNKTSKDTTKTEYVYNSNNYGKNGEIILKGNNTLDITLDNFFKSSQFAESPGIFMDILFRESLNNNFNLLQIQDQNNQSLINVQLVQSTSGRILRVNFTDTQIQYQFPQVLEANINYRIYIAFLRIQTQLQIMIIVNDELTISQIYTFPYINNGKFIFDQNGQQIEQGYVEIKRISFLDNSSAIFYKKFTSNSNCYQDCNFVSSIQPFKQECLICISSLALNVQQSICQQYCSFGSKSIQDICYTCQLPQCEELNQDDFQIQKIQQNQYKLTQNNKNLTIPNFENTFKLLLNNQDQSTYYTVQQYPQEYYAIYNLRIPQNLLNQQSILQWLPVEQYPIIKNDKNLYQRTLALNTQDPIGTIFPLISSPIISLPTIDPSITVTNQYNTIIEQNRKGNVQYERLGKAAFGIFIGSLFFGIIGMFYRCPYLPQDWNDFHYQKFIQTFLITQYFSCWLFYHIRLHDTLYGFLDKLFYYTIGWHKVFQNVTRSDYNSSNYFNEYYDRIVFRRFYEQNVYTTFLTNFSVIMIIQGAFLFLYIILKIISIIQNKKKQTQNIVKNTIEDIKQPIYYFEWNILITLFMIFIIETTFFLTYNFWHQKFHHRYFLFSLLFSILYLIINITLIAFIIMIALKDKQSILQFSQQNIDILSNYYISHRKTQFIWRGLDTNNKIQQIFHGLQYLYYGIFAFILVICYKSLVTQMTLNLINTIWFIAYIIILRPANDKFWKIEQIIVHFFIFIIKLLLSIVIFDKKYNNININNKNNIQSAIAIIMFLIIVWNFFVLLYGLIRRLQNCKKAKLTHEYIQNNTYKELESQQEIKKDKKEQKKEDTIQNDDTQQYISIHEQINKSQQNKTMQNFINRFKEDSGDQEYSIDDTSYVSDNFNSYNYKDDNYNNEDEYDEDEYNINKHKSLEIKEQNSISRKFTFNPNQFNRQSLNDESISFQKKDQRFKDEVMGFHNNNKKVIKGLNRIEEDSDEEELTKIPRFTN